MKGLVYEAPSSIRLRDVPAPEPAAGEALLRVEYCGICGSDVHGYLGVTGRRTPPMIMGHEFVGVVERIGAGVTRVKPGDRVAVQPLIFCGECPACRQGLTNRCPHRRMYGVMDLNGALAEYVAVHEKQIYPLPASIDPVEGSLLEPLAVAFSAVRRAGNAEARRAVVVGAGTIGLMIVQTLRATRPELTIVAADVNARRLELARQMGADAVCDTRSADAGKTLAGADLAFEAVGLAATVQAALAALRPGGLCVWVGNSAKMIDLNMQDVVTREFEIRGTYAYTHAAFGETLKLLAGGTLRLRPLVSRVAPLREGPALFDKLARGVDDLVKVILSA